MGIFNRQDQRRNEQGPRQGAGCSGRLITALMIALVAWFMYMNQVEENPVTGERQHVAISPDQEIKLGLESAPQMSKEMGGELSANDVRVIEVSKLGQRLINASEAKKSPWKFNFHVLKDSKTVNAFALPGGQIFITLGLLNKLQNEAQLAGVLGHEMGHVIERHTAQQMAKNQLGQMLVVAVSSAASDYANSQDASNPAIIAAVVNQVLQLRYSRMDESEADVWGLKIMEKTGLNPEQMIKVMEVLKAASGGGGQGLEFFQTHPNPDLRIQQIKAYLKEHPPGPNVSNGKNLSEIFKTSTKTPEQQDTENLLEQIFGVH